MRAGLITRENVSVRLSVRRRRRLNARERSKSKTSRMTTNQRKSTSNVDSKDQSNTMCTRTNEDEGGYVQIGYIIDLHWNDIKLNGTKINV